LKRDVRFEVAKNFYGFLLAQRELERHEEYRARLRSQDKTIRQLDGDAALEMEYSWLRQEISHRKHALEIARLDYLHVLGLELFRQVSVQGALETTPLKQTLEQYLAWAVNFRPELKQTRFEEEVNELSVNLALSQRNPVLAFGAGYELRDSNLSLGTSNWNATISLNLPLFDGFSTLSRIRQNRHRADQGRIRRADLQDSIQLEVRKAYQECRYWEAEMAAREETLQKAKEMARGSGLKLQRWLLQSQLDCDQAVYSHLLAKSELEHAIGRPLEE